MRWLVSDQLGTPRMVIDQTGSLAGLTRHDYLPFGEELYANVGGRTSAQGYNSADNVRQQFTGYERDDETGLDYAKARYYSASLGRFAGVDPLPSSARILKPQSWNRYSYVTNNPLRYVDPTGEYLVLLENVEEGLKKIKELVGKDLAQYVGTKTLTEGPLKGKTVVTISADLSKSGGKLADLGKIINSADKHIGLRVAENYQQYSLRSKNDGPYTVYVRGPLENGKTSGGGYTIDALKSLSGLTEVVLNPEAAKVAGEKLAEKGWKNVSSDGQPLGMTDAVVLGHEFGHAWGNVMLGQGLPERQTVPELLSNKMQANGEANTKEALAWENYFRDQDPELKGRHRTKH